jgi:hypothetical protein
MTHTDTSLIEGATTPVTGGAKPDFGGGVIHALLHPEEAKRYAPLRSHVATWRQA